MPNIAAYSAKCESCGELFRVPLLPDMSYGDFAACAQAGNVFGYLNAFDEPAWEVIKRHFDELKLDAPDKHKLAEAFQQVVGACMDAIEGHTMSILGGPYCPKCGGTRIHYDDCDADRAGSINIVAVTFRRFMLLNDNERREFVRDAAR